MICCCSLAGTSACDHCHAKSTVPMLKPERGATKFVDNTGTETGYTELNITSLMNQQTRISSLENAIKRLNERIDELLEKL